MLVVKRIFNMANLQKLGTNGCLQAPGSHITGGSSLIIRNTAVGMTSAYPGDFWDEA